MKKSYRTLQKILISLLPISAIFLSQNYYVTTISLLLGGFLAGTLAIDFKSNRFYFLILMANIIIIFLFRHKFSSSALFVLAPFVFSYLISFFYKQINFLVIFIFLALICTTIFIHSFTTDNSILNVINQKPITKGYNSDNILFLNVLYQMDHLNFYQAYTKAFEDDIRFDKSPSDIIGWRLPTIFYIWHYLGLKNFNLWLFSYAVTVIGIFSIYYYAKSFEGEKIGLAAVFLTTPYFGYVLSSEWFLGMEWWSLLLFLIGSLFWVYQKVIPSFLFFLIAILVRELLLIPYLVFLVFTIFSKNKQHFLFWLIVITTFLGFYIVHINFVLDNVIKAKIISSSRLFGGGINFLQTIFSFGSFNYLVVDLKIFSFYFLLSALFILIKIPKITNHYILTAPYILLLAFLVLGGKWREYWGILAIPLIIVNLPIIINQVIHKHGK